MHVPPLTVIVVVVLPVLVSNYKAAGALSQKDREALKDRGLDFSDEALVTLAVGSLVYARWESHRGSGQGRRRQTLRSDQR